MRAPLLRNLRKFAITRLAGNSQLSLWFVKVKVLLELGIIGVEIGGFPQISNSFFQSTASTERQSTIAIKLRQSFAIGMAKLDCRIEILNSAIVRLQRQIDSRSKL
jgi:hypothetical protein